MGGKDEATSEGERSGCEEGVCVWGCDVCVCVCACVRACVHACVHACVCVGVCVWGGGGGGSDRVGKVSKPLEKC